MAATEVVWNEAALHAYLSGPSGPVVHDLLRRGLRVESQAKINASHAPPSVPGSGPAVRTGRLRASITTALGEDAISVYVDIGTPVDYGKYVEQGTERMAARPYLRPALVAAQV